MNTISIILNLIPALIAVIKAVEAAVPGSGQGEAKLAAIRGILEASDAAAKDLWPKLQVVISVLVTLFNTVGEFKKSTV